MDDDDGVVDGDEELDSELEEVRVAESLNDQLFVVDTLPDAEGVGNTVGVAEIGSETELLGDNDQEFEGEGVVDAVGLSVGLTLCEIETDRVVDNDGDAEVEADCVVDCETDVLIVRDSEDVVVADGEADGELLNEMDGVVDVL